MYSFNGKIFIQSNGSPIVLSVVYDVSTIRMIPWYTIGVTKTEKTRIDLNKIMNSCDKDIQMTTETVANFSTCPRLQPLAG